jgi:transposase
MPRGKTLSDVEKGQVLAFKECGYSNRSIAKQLNRFSDVINKFINLGDKYGTNKRSGRKPTLTDRDKRHIVRQASSKNVFATEIKTDLSLRVGVRRIQQILSTSDVLVFTKRQKKPRLTAVHKEARLNWARKYLFSQNWDKILFSDEKKFNLDGPDGFQSYWHDLRKNSEIRFSRNFGGGSVMIWGAFSCAGTLPLAWITSTMKSQDYVDMLETSLVEHAEHLMGPEFIFQHDNAAVHTSKLTKNWFIEKDIEVFEWPSISPDMNPIENLWGIVASKVYGHGRQFVTVESLKKAIQEAWMKIKSETIQKLISSMPRRLLSIIESKGGSTKY